MECPGKLWRPSLGGRGPGGRDWAIIGAARHDWWRPGGNPCCFRVDGQSQRDRAGCGVGDAGNARDADHQRAGKQRDEPAAEVRLSANRDRATAGRRLVVSDTKTPGPQHDCDGIRIEV